MANLESIRARIAKLEAQAASVAAKQNSGVIKKIRNLMEQHGLAISDIEATVGKNRGRKPSANPTNARSAAAAKYQDPKTGATWSGHGRAPAWIAGAKDRTKFEVAASSSAPAKKAKALAKVGNYVRGPQPALYRDPKSGATWSGRGRAPAWIATAKDRTKFLIAETGVLTNSSSSPGKATAKRAAAKNSTTKTSTTKAATAVKKAVRAAPASEKVTAKKTVAKKAAAKKVSAKKAVTKNAGAKNVETNTAAPSAVVEHINGAATAQQEE
ncbi:H-NS family nucleoid-associated regulatory protein [Paraburkholderia sp. Cpub6]|uniref:H-NS family nucleoid-associated regulatory protein n=1 Tax=Paraburkholderia sp. Cpub6 TaxID=2723094 RepID=UPI00160A59CB|nr:H-NS family nucleoid-associated regulatory protein [Paraburkholderia sp. Cpub6]MBB5462341.1 DNA-binding protein H-NS [Paraburkholderia sp. Cpub6]